jgi:hypothetical protein
MTTATEKLQTEINDLRTAMIGLLDAYAGGSPQDQSTARREAEKLRSGPARRKSNTRRPRQKVRTSR